MKCSICDSDASRREGFNPIECSRCGMWEPLGPRSGEVSLTLAEQLGGWDSSGIRRRSRLSHLIRRQQRAGGASVSVPLGQISTWGLDDPPPTPAQQVNDLILWIGEHQGHYADTIHLDARAASAWIGAPVSRTEELAPIGWLLRREAVRRYIDLAPGTSAEELSLSFDGWAKYDSLRRERVDSRNAFMAMKFGDEAIQRVVHECFRPAVADAGFTLRTLNDGQPAGCIDDQLRVALRTARFVVADLTHANQGAYWEAGFAEGLGRPVIYTCRKAEWDRERTHFDTNHLVTIIWDPDDLPDAGRRLSDVVRVTLPAEAKPQD